LLTDTLDFGGTSYSVDYWQIDLSAVTSSTLNFNNPNTLIVPTYNLHFDGVTTDTVNFANTLLDANGDTISQHIFSQGQIVPIYYENGIYNTNYITLQSSPSTAAANVTYTNNNQSTAQTALDSLFNRATSSISEGTPSYRNDPASAQGTLLYNDTALYVKTSLGWAYSSLTLMDTLTPLTLSYSSDLIYAYVRDSLITEDANGVSQWGDFSGNSRHMTQPVNARKPSTDVSGNIVFDGVDDFLLADTSWFSTINDSSYTLILAAEILDSTNTTQTIFTTTNDGNTGLNVLLSANWVSADTFKLNTRFLNGGSPTIDGHDTLAIGTRFLWSALGSKTSSTQARINGVQSGSVNNTGTWNHGLAKHVHGLGGYYYWSTPINANETNLKVYFLAAYKRKLTPAEIAVVENEVNNYLSIY